MTVYGKIENGNFIPAPYGEIEDLISQGYSALDDETVQNYITKSLFQSEINELDIKRIRAIVEPSSKTTTQTWLEYYTEKIIELRNQIADL